mgnify:CR=1 FL=1
MFVWVEIWVSSPELVTHSGSRLECSGFTGLRLSEFAQISEFLAALAALCPPWSLTDLLMVVDLEPSRPNQTKPTWPTYLTYFPGPPELPRSLTYPPTWPTHPSVLPTYLIYPPIQITSQNRQITSLNPQITFHSTDSTILTKFHNFNLKFQNFNQNFRILTKFQNLGQISEFWPDFRI